MKTRLLSITLLFSLLLTCIVTVKQFQPNRVNFLYSRSVDASAQKDSCWTATIYQENSMVLMCNSPCCYFDDHINNTTNANGACRRTAYPMCFPPE